MVRTILGNIVPLFIPEEGSNILQQDTYHVIPRHNSLNCIFFSTSNLKFLLYFSTQETAGVPKIMIVCKPFYKMILVRVNVESQSTR
jgi:hypothetical protein